MKIIGIALLGTLALGAPPGWVEIELPLRNSQPSGLAWGYDGKLYGTEYTRGRFFRLDATMRKVTMEWPIPKLREALPVVALPGRILAGAENGIAVLDTRTGTVTEIPLPNVSVTGLAVDRATQTVYFTNAHTGAISKLNGTKVTPFAVVRARSGDPCVPYGIVFEPRGKDVYVDCERADEIWRVRPDGTKKAFPIPAERSSPRELTLGRDGDVYASLYDAGAVAQLDPATGEVQVWRGRSSTKVGGVAFDTSDRLWFTLPLSGAVAQLDRPGGGVTEYGLTRGAVPTLVSAGPGGRLFSPDLGRDMVGVFNPPAVASSSQRVFTRDLYKRTRWTLTVTARGTLAVDVLAAPGTAVTLTGKPKVARTLDLVGHQRFRVAARAGTRVALTLDVRALEPQTVTVRISPVR